MADHPCTVGALRDIYVSSLPADQATHNPILQVLQVKPIAGSPDAPERFRIVLSDTVNFIQAMLATQSNDLIREGRLQKGSFVQLTTFSSNTVKGKKILIVTTLTVLSDYPIREKIGTPVALEEMYAGQNPQQPAQNPNQGASNANAFYGNKPAPAPPTRNIAQSRAPAAATTETHANVYPIDAISPYQNRWTIKARVTHKSDIKTWNKASSSGKLFTVNFLDESGEIRATGFNQECDKFYELLQEGRVYYVSKARVNMAKKQFSNVDNDYEIMFTRDTEIEPCVDDSIPQMRFSFVKIADLEHVEKDAIVDAIGVIKEVGDLDKIVSKNTQKPYSKRDITLVDQSNTWVKCTIWGAQAENWDLPVDNVVAFKGVRVGDFGGKTLSMLYTSTMTPNPDIDEAHTLKGWYDGQGNRDLSTFQNHQALASTMGVAGGNKDPFKNVQQVRDENLGMNEETPDRFSLKATIVYIKRENISYPACLTEKCNKKVRMVDEGSWQCDKCNQMYPHPNYRYIMSVSVNDAFGQLWLSCFDDVGKMIMGVSADELHELHEKGEMEGGEYKLKEDALFTDALCRTYVFRVRAKPDTYDDQIRPRYQVTGAAPLNFAQEAQKLADLIKMYN
ncbi:replication factor-a protein [Ascodesmis nigricans]|uniref:Replication protein A subunit n=1 Tax=Ascodesmis nigricans TaxID=341454 RepID=A0A4S2N494_9PEZI|nr:replication factor-a protein [Ascodesmis nigricans]